MQDSTKYMTQIESLANFCSNQVFYNSGKFHASWVMSRIFKYSRSKVRIFAGNLNGAVSAKDEYVKELLSFVKRGGAVEVLLDSYDSANISKTLNLLKIWDGYFPNLITVKSTNLKLEIAAGDDPNKKVRVHFTSGDDRMYRLEFDTDSYKAQGNFNDPVMVSQFASIFDKIFSSSSQSRLLF